jgi:YD repeat-containing protein
MSGYKKFATCVLLSSVCFDTTAFAQLLPPPPEHPQIDENGVDIQSLSFLYSHRDLSIGPADHHGLEYIRYFGTSGSRDSFSNTMTVIDGDISSANVSIGNKSESFDSGIPRNGEGSTLGSANYGDYTRKDGTIASFGHYVLGGVEGWFYDAPIFSAYYFADYLEYPDGVRLTFHYLDAQFDDFINGINYPLPETRLQSVTTNTGYQIKFFYESDTMTSDPLSKAAWLTVTKAVAINNAIEYCDPDANSCAVSNSWPYSQYSASANPDRYAIDSTGAETHYAWDGFQFKVKTSDSASYNRVYSIAYVYDPSSVTAYWFMPLYGNAVPISIVPHVTHASIDGKETDYSFSYSYDSHTSTVKSYGPLGDNRTYDSYIGEPGVVSFTDANNITFNFSDDRFFRLQSVTNPEGNSTQYVYDNNNYAYLLSNGSTVWYFRGNITSATANSKPGSGMGSLTEGWEFPSCTSPSPFPDKICNQPTSYTDPRGNTTTYTYDPAHGGKLTETLPAGDNGIHPVKRYAYAERYAWIKNSVGSYVQAETPIWVLTEERTCLTSATVNGACAVANDEIVTSYDYGPDSGPNNLLLRGVVVTAGGESRRTCYSYDVTGNKISETLPRAGLTSCP